MLGPVAVQHKIYTTSCLFPMFTLIFQQVFFFVCFVLFWWKQACICCIWSCGVGRSRSECSPRPLRMVHRSSSSSSSLHLHALSSSLPLPISHHADLLYPPFISQLSRYFYPRVAASAPKRPRLSMSSSLWDTLYLLSLLPTRRAGRTETSGSSKDFFSLPTSGLGTVTES